MNRAPGPGEMHGEYHSDGLKPPLMLTEEQITNAIVGCETNGRTRVSYGKHLQPQAALVARALEQALDETERNLEAPLPVRPHIYLLRLTNEQHVIQFSLSAPDPRTLPWAMVLTSAPTNLASAPEPGALLAELPELPAQLFTIAHEMCEAHLVDPTELLVMGDVATKIGFIPLNLKYHTRWFRDGLAHYTACKASQAFCRQAAQAGAQPDSFRCAEDGLRPLSQLAKAKDKVFDWNQDSKTDYYAAALGLFLLLEQRQGPGAIPDIIHHLPNVPFPDDKGLRKMIRQQTGVDLRQLARSFEFPDLGFETHINADGRLEIKTVAPNSWAVGARLFIGDVILKANDCPVHGHTDLELQILKALDQGGELSLLVSRHQERVQTKALPLAGAK